MDDYKPSIVAVGPITIGTCFRKGSHNHLNDHNLLELMPSSVITIALIGLFAFNMLK